MPPTTAAHAEGELSVEQTLEIATEAVQHFAFRGVDSARRHLVAGCYFLWLSSLNHIGVKKLPGTGWKLRLDNAQHLLDQVLPMLFFFEKPMGVVLSLVECGVEALRRFFAF